MLRAGIGERGSMWMKPGERLSRPANTYTLLASLLSDQLVGVSDSPRNCHTMRVGKVRSTAEMPGSSWARVT